jgi:hypothetical protein
MTYEAKYELEDLCYALIEGKIVKIYIETVKITHLTVKSETNHISAEKPYSIKKTNKNISYKVYIKEDERNWYYSSRSFAEHELFDTKEEAAVALLKKNGIDLSVCMKEN